MIARNSTVALCAVALMPTLAMPLSLKGKPDTRRYPQRHVSRRDQQHDPLHVEKRLVRRRGYDFIIGSDESGRGCIAGPIVMASCCVMMANNTVPCNVNEVVPIPGVQDSKALSPQQRNCIYDAVHAQPHVYKWSIALAEPSLIDGLNGNAQRAAMMGFAESIENVATQVRKRQDGKIISLYSIVDGHKSPEAKQLSMPCRPWKRADTIVYSVALASILARVHHDRIMQDNALRFPQYDFEHNGGYPTQSHMHALHHHGPSIVHRKSCRPVKRRLLSKQTIPSISRTSFMMSALASVVYGSAGFVTSPRSARAMTTDPKTGVALPDVGEIANAVPKDWTGLENPVYDRDTIQFDRLDNTDDFKFYAEPRYVEHVDDAAVGIMTGYISNVALSDATSVLDLCSSWTSHITPAAASKLNRVAGLGMNMKELEANKLLTDRKIQDLNRTPKLPYSDNSFDNVLCQLSIDYLTKPLQVCAEVGRVLRPGGKIHVMFSNRLFLTKAVGIWTGADDVDHAFLVASYLHFAGDGIFKDIEAQDLSRRQGRQQRIAGDPMYVVRATKSRPNY